jgi:hypothetical protein
LRCGNTIHGSSNELPLVAKQPMLKSSRSAGAYLLNHLNANEARALIG